MSENFPIGATVFYRKPNEKEMKSSVVTSERAFKYLDGTYAFNLLKLENGDEVAETEVYLES